MTLVPLGKGAETAGIPRALRSAATYPGLVSILRGDQRADPVDKAGDAMLALQAISKHVRGCAGPNAETVAINIAVTETTRDGFGTERSRETTDYREALRVRPEFAPWVRRNLGLYPVMAISTVRDSVLELISQEGCDGAGFRQLEQALAAFFEVSLPRVAEGGGAPSAGGIPENAAGFIAECRPTMARDMQIRGQNVGERMIASMCICAEHAARVISNMDLYAALRVQDFGPLEADPVLAKAYDEEFMPCFHAPEGSALRLRQEQFWRENNI